MNIAERLYNKGLISYPRTDTNCYHQSINLKSIIEILSSNSEYNAFSSKILHNGLWIGPNNGRRDDKAHPPIHPIRVPSRSELSAIEIKVYDLIVRQFLASISKDTKVIERQYTIQISHQSFIYKSSYIKELGFKEILSTKKCLTNYIIEEWNDLDLNLSLSLAEKKTIAPYLYSESDLIEEMDRNNIGTDATIHEHIKTVLDRNYCYKKDNRFYPSEIGILLIESYSHIGVHLYKPYLRAQMEKDLELIAKGVKTKCEVVSSCLKEMKRIFDYVQSNIQEMKDYFSLNRGKITLNSINQTNYSSISLNNCIPAALHIEAQPLVLKDIEDNMNHAETCNFRVIENTEFCKCSKCNKGNLHLQYSLDKQSYYVKCTNSEYCQRQYYVSSNIISISLNQDSKCFNCEMYSRNSNSILDHPRSRIFFEDSRCATQSICLYENCDDAFSGIKKLLLNHTKDLSHYNNITKLHNQKSLQENKVLHKRKSFSINKSYKRSKHEEV